MADALEPIKDLLHRVRGAVARPSRNEHSGLRVVREPKRADIDIVAVHGLGGEGFSAWVTWDPKRSGRPKSWLEELLAKDVPNARIMTYGYTDGVNYRYLVRNVLYGRALDLVKELSAHRRQDRTHRRPIFFIAHSLGGWIVKRALIISSEAADPDLKHVELSTCGVAFFGTLSPGRPSSPSPLANVIRRTTTGFGEDQRRASLRRSSSSFIGQPNSSDVEWLENQMEAFKAITANLPRLSFYETKKSSDGFVVEQRNSMSGSDGIQIGLTATHSDLIKFRGRDANYRAFIDKFREMVDKTRTSGFLEAKQKLFDLAAVHRLDYVTADFSIPYTLPWDPSTLVPRPDLLADLEAILSPSDDPQQLHLSIAKVWGHPGTGKATLAKHYAQTHEHDLSFVFWIGAESWETVVVSYLEFANSLVSHYSKDTPRSRVENDLGLTGVDDMLKVKSVFELDNIRVKSVVRSVKDWLLRPENDKWLIVFDNVEPSLNILDFIPLTLTGKIIFTCRDKSSCPLGTELGVGPLSPEQALKLMQLTLGETLVDPEQVVAAQSIAEHLEYHSRSISLAASTIRQKGLTVDQYYRQLSDRSPLVTVGSTLDQSPVTRTVLRLSAMLSTSTIPVALFTGTSHLTEIPERLTSIFGEIKMFQNLGHVESVLQYLLDENFIQTPSSSSESPTSSQTSYSSFDSFVLDSEARDHIRSSLSSDEQVDHAWLACNLCVDGIRKQESDSATLSEIHNFGRIMAPHAKTCYDDWSRVLENWPEDEDIAWQVLGNVCMTQGALDQAAGCFELALKHKDSMEAIERIQTSLSLVSILNQTGDVERSREVLANVDIAFIDTALGFRVAMAKASAAAAQGELSRAEDQYSTLEQKQEQALGPTDIMTVGTVQRLAVTLEQLGKKEEAQALYRRVYISYQNMFGQSHPMTLEALEDLANISRECNAIDEAESLYRQSVDIKMRTLGPEHPSTAHALEKLAVMDDFRGRYEAARSKYQSALETMAPTVGRAHPLYTMTMENMALSARWHGHSLYSYDNHSDVVSSSDNGNSSKNTSQNRSRGSSNEPSKQPAVSREMQRKAAFESAEKLYLDVLDIKRAAKDLYSDEQVLATGSKLCEMYDHEPFYASERVAKVEDLMKLLKENRQREGTA